MNELVVYWTGAALVGFSVLFFLSTLTKIHQAKVGQPLLITVGVVWVLGLVYIFYM